jgi:hypothetical protein
MRSFGVTSTAPPVRHSPAHEVHGSHVWRDSLADAAVALVGIGAFAFVLIVLPWVISL